MMLMLRLELVRQDLAVVAEHASGNSAVVVLMTDDPAAAGVDELLGDEAVFVPIFEMLHVHNPPARGQLVLDTTVGGFHDLRSLRHWSLISALSAQPRQICSVSVPEEVLRLGTYGVTA
jgi:hypothetical protein